MRIGILGGTFDPIHAGHLALARGALRTLRLDRILFVPDRIPPHKTTLPHAEPWDRYRMVQEALRDEPLFQVCRIELGRPGPSYTADTLIALRARYGRAAEWVFLAGTDCLDELPRWRRFAEVRRLCRFTVVARPGFPVRRTLPGVHVLSLVMPDVSSSDVRRRLAGEEDVDGRVPERTLAYIRARRLYRRSPRRRGTGAVR